MRYNGTCFCEAHPCPSHKCNDPVYPLLTYDYDRSGKVDCYCRKSCPDNICGGQRVPLECSRKEHHCPRQEHPIMTYSDGQCKCKTHPCVVAGRAKCAEPERPWLDYAYDRNGGLDCFCRRDPCTDHVCEEPKYPYPRFDQEGHCYCSSIPFVPYA